MKVLSLWSATKTVAASAGWFSVNSTSVRTTFVGRSNSKAIFGFGDRLNDRPSCTRWAVVLFTSSPNNGALAAFPTVREGLVMFAFTLPPTVTVPLTGKGVFTTLTGTLGGSGAAATVLRRGLAPTVPVVMNTATAARPKRAMHSERIFFGEYIVFPP